MRKIVCAGCGRTERLDLREHKIVEVSFSIEEEASRSWEQAERYKEDLCEDCIKEIVSKFFGVLIPAGELLMPTASAKV